MMASAEAATVVVVFLIAVIVMASQRAVELFKFIRLFLWRHILPTHLPAPDTIHGRIDSHSLVRASHPLSSSWCDFISRWYLFRITIC
jgi:hypothetical protein